MGVRGECGGLGGGSGGWGFPVHAKIGVRGTTAGPYYTTAVTALAHGANVFGGFL